MASIFALLSVGLAKGNAVYGLKALGGFMEGAHASNVEQAKAALDDYNEKMKEVHEINDNAYREYNAIFNNTKMGMEAQTQMAHQAALKFDDQLQIENLRTGNLVEFNKIQNQRFKNQIEMAKAIGQTEALAERIRRDKAMESKATKPNTEEYKLLAAQRAQGKQTGNELIDNLTTAQAKTMAGLEPKPTAASSKAADQLVGTSNVLKEIEAMIPEMDKKGFLAQGSGKASELKAEFNRWKNPSDPTLAKWQSLKGSIVGFDRMVFNDIGARVRAAYDGSLELFDKPYTAEGLRSALGGYRSLLENSPEAKRVLGSNPEALDYKTSGGGDKLTIEEARGILQEVGGDKAKARELARQRGRSF
jgi:hypothetical protein